MPHTAKNKITWINLCVSGVPLPQYIKDQRGEAGWPHRAHQESPTPSGSRIPPPNPSWNRIREVGKERERRRGAPAPSLLVLFGLGVEGHAAHAGRPSLFSTKAHKAHYSPGGFR